MPGIRERQHHAAVQGEHYHRTWTLSFTLQRSWFSFVFEFVCAFGNPVGRP